MNLPRKRPAFAALLPKLEALGFRPSKRFGQNFLVDDAMCREVAAASGVGPGDFALEVGVGLGFLTHHLLLRGARVLGVEIDSRLAAVTREWMGDEPNLELCVTDVLDGKHALAADVVERLPANGPWHLVSNLPYAVASPVVALLVRLPNPPRSLTMLVQHEVAERFVARPGDDAWGALSLRLSLSHRGKILRPVPANLFRPRPKVDSSICRLEVDDGAPPTSWPSSTISSVCVSRSGANCCVRRSPDCVCRRGRPTCGSPKPASTAICVWKGWMHRWRWPSCVRPRAHESVKDLPTRRPSRVKDPR
jgi:16S rRNA A1518/A1519 N6-dimethyltransferase RsmA/KsgA/DIM1 with predicted DNA glycosylase/AP lyase activity